VTDLSASGAGAPTRDGFHPLEPSAAEMRRMADAVTERLVRFVEGLPEAPTHDLDEALPVALRLREAAPEVGSPLEPLLDVVMDGAARAVNTTSPGFLGYVPGGGLYAAAVADFLACGINRYVGLWNQAPVLAGLEWNVVRWLCDLFGLPERARGVLTSGGSMSNLSAIVAARHHRLPVDFLSGVLYLSAQAHASIAKAAAIAGLPAANVRQVPVDGRFRMDMAALRRALREDRERGLRPFCVVASAGTTNTGAVDPIGELAEVARTHSLWLHVDAAYGGFFQLTARGRAELAGIDAADSITLDPHKGMFLPYGTGALLVREGAWLRAAYRTGGDYLQDMGGDGEIPNFSDYSPELSRDFRGLRLWLAVKLHGWASFRAALDEKLDLARQLYDELRRDCRFEVVEPVLSVVAFRYRPPSGDVDQFNRLLLTRINASRRVLLSSTVLDGRFTIRACVLCHRTHRAIVEEAGAIIRDAAAGVARERWAGWP
jgi:aromatic-L-amino-acid decarboxylase